MACESKRGAQRFEVCEWRWALRCARGLGMAMWIRCCVRRADQLGELQADLLLPCVVSGSGSHGVEKVVLIVSVLVAVCGAVSPYLDLEKGLRHARRIRLRIPVCGKWEGRVMLLFL